MNVTDTNTYISQIRTQATNLITTLQKLHALEEKRVALDLGNTLNQTDIGGDNEGILLTDCMAVLTTTLAAFDAVLDAGHGTNLHKIAII